MGKGYRQGRLGEEIRKIIGSMLIHQIKDPRLSSMISISGVDVTSDGSYATCYVSVLDMNETGQEKEALEKDILGGACQRLGPDEKGNREKSQDEKGTAADIQDGSFHRIRRAYR